MNWRNHAKRVLSAVSELAQMAPPTHADLVTAANRNGFTIADVGAGAFSIRRNFDGLYTIAASATAAVEWMKEHAQ